MMNVKIESNALEVSGLASGTQRWRIEYSTCHMGKVALINNEKETVIVGLSGDYIEGIIRAYVYLGLD